MAASSIDEWIHPRAKVPYPWTEMLIHDRCGALVRISVLSAIYNAFTLVVDKPYRKTYYQDNWILPTRRRGRINR